MNKRKKSFAENYLATGNAEQSAQNAGYKSKGYGKKLLNNGEIEKYLKNYADGKNVATADEVLEFLTSVMRGEEWEIKVNVKKDSGEKTLLGEPPSLSQRQKAAELLAKRYRLFSETAEEENGEKTFSVNIRVV